MATFEDWKEIHLLEEMRRRGYIVRHESETRQRLSWHHLEPAPEGFEDDALAKIKEQLTKEHLHFETRTLPGGKPVRSALLRII